MSVRTCIGTAGGTAAASCARDRGGIGINTFRLACYVVIATIGTIVAGCSTGPDSPYAAPETRPLAEPATPGHLATDIDQLELVMRDAFYEMHWGWMHVTNDITALEAMAVTPDDREVIVTAQRAAEDGVNVSCRVGPFGDAKLEAEFLRRLARLVARAD